MMPLAASRPYAKSANWSEEVIRDIFESTKREFASRLERCRWMDPATRQAAIYKMNSVHGVFPKPVIMDNDSALEVLYSCIPDATSEPFLASFLAGILCKQRHILKTAAEGTVSYKSVTWTSPASYMVSYLHAYNSVFLMGAVIQPPLLRSSGPHKDVYNFAGLGSYMGRLLFHSVDQTGSLRNPNGTPFTWWSDVTKTSYAKAVGCLEDVYQFESKYIQESIADNVAPAALFSAYERRLEESAGPFDFLSNFHFSWRSKGPNDLNDDKVFFMNLCFCLCSSRKFPVYYAGTTTAEDRCNLPLKSTPEFWRAFDCRPGDEMRARDACQLL